MAWTMEGVRIGVIVVSTDEAFHRDLRRALLGGDDVRILRHAFAPGDAVAPGLVCDVYIVDTDTVSVEAVARACIEPPPVVAVGSAAAAAQRFSGVPVARLGEAPTPAQLLAAVAAVHAGLSVTPAAAASAPGSPLGADGSTAEELSERELDVLELVASGQSNKAIAGRLGISENTVKFHLGSIYGKLGVAGRAQAVSVALQSGRLTL